MSAANKQKNKGNFLTDLARRGVYQAVGIYVAIAWGSIEILITASERFGWPDWVGNAALTLFLTGLPFVILLSWAFDLTGSGIKRMEPDSLKGKALIAGAFTLTLGISASWFLSNSNLTDEDLSRGSDPNKRPVIAVMPFKDFVNDENSGLMTLSFADELINRINAHPDLAALNLGTVTRMGMISPNSPPVTADYFLEGAFRPAQVGTELSARLTDNSGLVHWEFETVDDLDDVRKAHSVQAYLAGEVASKLGVSLAGRDYCEPSDNAQAVRLYYEAKKQFEKRGPDNVAGAALKLEKAVELDHRFARALDLLGSVYERFPRWVSRDPAQYGMTAEELQSFVDSRPYIPILKRALDICPSLGSAYVTVELSAPVSHSLADLIDLTLEALRRDPGNTPLLDRAIYTYQSMGHLDTAGLMAEEYLQRDPLNPWASMLAAMILRAQGNSRKAMELSRNALVLSDALQWEGIALAYDRLVEGDNDALAEGLGDDFSPGTGPDTFPLDPRLLAELDINPEARSLLIDQLEVALQNPTDPGSVFSDLLGAGGGPPWAFEMNDSELAWSLLEQVSEIAPPGFAPYGFWYKRHRHWFGNQRLVELIGTWTDEYEEFWNRHGPPDGCEWDDSNLHCEWTNQSPAVQ